MISGRAFDEYVVHDSQSFSNYRLENCEFGFPSSLVPDQHKPDPTKRPTIRNVTLTNSRFQLAYLEGAILEDVTLDGLRCGRHPAFLRFNAFRHVTLRGEIGRVVIRDQFAGFNDLEDGWQDFEDRWRAANQDFYATVDWALDITDAVTSELEISGVPGRLIRYDPEFAAILTQEAARSIPWRKLPFQDGLGYQYLYELAQGTLTEAILIANRRSKNFKAQWQDIRMLRENGLL